MTTPIDAISAMGALKDVAMEPQVAAAGKTQPFEMVEKLVNEANDKVVAADQQVRNLAVGQAGSLHEVMFALESARISMGLMVQVRNRVVDAYQDLMRMQI